jgi:site-specific DNA recombinase
MKSVEKKWVENLVVARLKEVILNEKGIAELSQKVFGHYLKQKADSSGEGEYLADEIRKTEKKISNLVDAIADSGKNTGALVDRLNLLEEQKATLEVRLQEWQSKYDKLPISAERIADYLNHYRQLLDEGTPEECKQVIQEFVEKVIVYPDDIKITFKVSVDSNGGGEPYSFKATIDRKMLLNKFKMRS